VALQPLLSRLMESRESLGGAAISLGDAGYEPKRLTRSKTAREREPAVTAVTNRVSILAALIVVGACTTTAKYRM
jgi:hypothetical protein